MANDSARQDLIEQVRQEQQKRPRAPRMQRAPRPEGTPSVARTASDGAPGDTLGDAPADEGAAPRKRRRRRRPGGRGGNGSGIGSEG